ncbi:MAG: hypothetical protein IJN50_03110 [Clostridia bacterium]|nr:hypothetical protein [Clostridia bacterium]
MEKDKKMSISIVNIICIVIIIILLAVIGIMYTNNYQDDNTDNSKEDSSVINQESIENESSDFEKIYQSLSNPSKSNIGEFIASDNEIKDIFVNNITIYTKEYTEIAEIKIPEEDIEENKIIGYCEYTIEFKDIEGLSLAGSSGNVSGTINNKLVDGKLFIYDIENEKIELVTGF